MPTIYPLKIPMRITLKGRIPSKKNNKQRTGKALISSKAYRERESEQLQSLKEQVNKLELNDPIYIHYKFYMPDARKTDLSNKVESINDLLVKYWLLEDDNRTIIKQMFITSEGIDRNNPRCEINIKFLYTCD